MPILNDIMDHGIIGPAIRQGLQKGREEGLQEGLQQGLQQGVQQGLHRGELTIIRRMLNKRFGSLPGWAEEQLNRFSSAELEEFSTRMLDVASIDELFTR